MKKSILQLLADYECIGMSDEEGGVTVMHFESSSEDLLGCTISIPTKNVDDYDIKMYTRKPMTTD